MLVDQITPEELDIVEALYHPRGCAECLFSNADNLSLFNDDFINIRLCQIPMLSFEYLIDEDPNLTEKENFARKKMAGDITVLGGRLFGKTWTVEKIDFNLYTFHAENEPAGFSSFDHPHLQHVLDEMYNIWYQHPIISLFKKRVIRNPYKFVTHKGVTIDGINMNVNKGNQAGDQFFQKHFKRIWVEEKSKETKVVADKRADSTHEIGCVIRESGMTDFTKYSPAGEIWGDPEKRGIVLNLPQYANPNFDEADKKLRIKKFHGESSIGYRVYVGGEVVEEGISAIDMQLVRDMCYPHNKKGEIDETQTVKHFEISKKTFNFFKALLILERPSNADRLFICADIGDTGGTSELIIITDVKGKYRYTHNITLRDLTNKQSYLIFKYLFTKLKADYISLDCTDGTGRAIYRDLEADKKIGKKHLIWCHFNEKIVVGFEKDENDKPKLENGKPIVKYENTLIHSIQWLCNHIFYEGLILLKYDYTLDRQLNSVVAIARDKSVVYHCLAENNHLFQAFQVFAIAQFKKEFEGHTKTESEFKKKHLNAGA